MRAPHSRQDLGHDCVVLEMKQPRRGNPEASVAILVDGSEIGVVLHREGENAYRRVREAKHSGLRADPEVLLSILEEIQNGIAGQLVGRGDMDELAVGALENSLADGSDPEDPVGRLPQDAYRGGHLSDWPKMIEAGRHRIQTGHGADPNRSITCLRD